VEEAQRGSDAALGALVEAARTIVANHAQRGGEALT
jgi:hypothetical protein